jgi:pyrrolidone-carboxylate peptidase
MNLASQLGRPLLLLSLALAAGACAAPTGEAADDGEDAVVVDTRDPAAKKQYDANLAFATGYTTTCAKPSGAAATRPRLLVTGFGRFQGITNNATGRIVSRVVPGLAYPETSPAPEGEVDAPAAQTAVKLATITLPGAGEVDVCGMILPVYWDLAAILIAREVEAFEPSFVMMDGVADDVQPLWLELGSVNRAMQALDGSDKLMPLPPAGQDYAPLIRSASKADTLKGLFLSYGPVQDAAKKAIADRAAIVDDDGRKLSDVLQGALRAGFPRAGNTYLCNNVAYVTNYVMSNPGKSVTLLQASTSPSDGVKVKITKATKSTPRVFVHWPSTLAGKHVDAAADVMRAIVDAQLVALRDHTSPPVVGTNAMAEIQASGPTF